MTVGCGTDCLSIAGMAFIVTVRDARTQQLLVAGTTLVAYGTGGADSITYPDDTPPTVTSLMLSEGRLNEGVYTVEVRRPGYVTWRRENVRLDDGECGHPKEPVRLTVLLAPTQQ
jgi:hypothetical protein